MSPLFIERKLMKTYGHIKIVLPAFAYSSCLIGRSGLDGLSNILLVLLILFSAFLGAIQIEREMKRLKKFEWAEDNRKSS